jgi:hypothetical protein
MNIRYAHGGSSIIAPLGIPLVPPTFGEEILYAECQAWMIKVWKSIVDTMGHYARPDVLKLMIRGEGDWAKAGTSAAFVSETLSRDRLRRAADEHEVEADTVEEMAEALVRQA